MINVRFDSASLMKTLNNAAEYSLGFMEGIKLNRLEFNKMLGEYTAKALEEYIDSKARMNPESLHHVYEWGAVGDRGGRLFKFNVTPTATNIVFTGSFLPSKSINEGSTKPFEQKAQIMEDGISITVEPRNSGVLAFEEDGETVFTSAPVTILSPGGPATKGSFSEVVEEFFNYYFTNSILYALSKELSYPDEFAQFFTGVKSGGRQLGISAGRKYFKVTGSL